MSKKKKKRNSGAKTIIVVVLVAALVVCGYLFYSSRLFGTYEAKTLGSGASYTFSGINSVTINVSILGNVVATVDGKYSIDGNTITITLNSDENGKDASEASKYTGTSDFAKGKDENGNEYIQIGMVQYKKVK